MGAVLSAICPVFLVAGIAYIVARRLDLHIRTLATLNLYVFIPALIFAHFSPAKSSDACSGWGSPISPSRAMPRARSPRMFKKVWM